MDEKEKDESRMRLREEALARRMGEALDRISAAGAGECPDAEVIAAYHERALQPDEMAQWEGHFAGCSRCRKILAVLAASVDTPLADTEVARLGELVAAAARPADVAAPRKAKLIKSSRFDWRARWLAPALGVAAVLAMWFAMRAPWRTTGQGPAETLVAQAPKSEPLQERNMSGSDQISGVESKKAPETAPALPNEARTRPATASPESPETNRVTESRSVGHLKAKVAMAETTPENENKARGLSDNAAREASAPTSSPSPASAATAQLQAPRDKAHVSALNMGAMSNSPARDNQAAGGFAGEGVASAARSATAMAKNGRNMQAFSSDLDAAKLGDIQILTPSGKVMWRAGKGGRIQRSSDFGRTWTSQASPSQQDWLAGAATSDMVCWLVGRNGSIARTTDGERWMQIASPTTATAPSSQISDWTGVTASSARVATITSNDNQHYRTEDGGQTWRLQ
jgi:hypothetical protein